MRSKRLRGYFTPRVARKFLMADGSVIPVMINRRGCTTKWTDADDHYLGELVEALHALRAESPALDSSARTTP